ncbi:hypothetical protein K2173_007050 [Erythroxylum novogranatense]|uniref:PWWP domain-containing protein n=1 Tax=Erythroxylum novogranatense TaxID=1862640 RepID=A0AAV8SKI9_9ROSI|nr:hypothetical protein K2173_007050 [Erythroxylum novogranatense]
MGSSTSDGGIGPIVWVRRRNGSWWPGKILEAEELSECNLTSPRTGTPVKLLGREDASVDWYNLEKSKRVKAFRCGEFDDCIERAESAQGMPIKKREKYARREDAILHALELEKKLSRKQGKLTSDCSRSKLSGHVKNDLCIPSEGTGKNSGKPENSKPNQFIYTGDMNFKGETISSPMHSLKVSDGNQSLQEDNGSEVTPRMRGLQDFGLRTMPLKRKLSSIDVDDLGKSLTDNHSQVSSSIASSMERGDHPNGVEQTGAIYRAKRSRCVYLPVDISDPLGDKELHSRVKTLVPQFENDKAHHHPDSLKEDNSSSGSPEDAELDSTESETSGVESESDSSETEPDIEKEMAVFSDAGLPTAVQQDSLGHPETRELGSTSTDDRDELILSGDIHQLYPDDPFYANEAVSKWQLKGKRNTRQLAKKYTADGKGFNEPLYGNYHRIQGSTLISRAHDADDPYLDNKYIGPRFAGLRNGSYSCTPRFSMKNRNSGSLNVDWEDTTWGDRPIFRGCWGDRVEHFNPNFAKHHYFGSRSRSILVDVDLQVQASYQREHVPIVSLMSNFNGQAIIGHRIQIKALEDGSTENLIPSSDDYYGNEVMDHDGSTALSPTWRTARRTNLRVPRPHLSPLMGANDSRDLSFVGDRRLPLRKAGSSSNKESLIKKNLVSSPRFPTDRKFSRKLSKKVSSSPNQKTRTLSSIGIQQNFGMKPINSSSTIQMEGLIKPQTAGPTTVACIPVKLVFSRLLEKINRPPLKAPGKAAGLNRDPQRPP